MAIPDQSGYYNSSNQRIVPLSSDTWTNHSGLTWDSWTSWDTPNSSITWYANVVDLGTPQSFTLNITTTSSGSVSYKIYSSLTGQFQGEETETIIASGASNVSSFYGQYVLVVVIATYTTQPLYITNIVVNPVAGSPMEIAYKDLDTSTLSGTTGVRTLSLTSPVSQILEILVTPHEVTSYNLDLYVSHTATSTFVIPKVISKSISGPVIALVGLDNQPRDAVVDILIKALGSQHMVGNNLVSN